MNMRFPTLAVQWSRIWLVLSLTIGAVSTASSAQRPAVNWSALTAKDAVPGQLLVGYKPNSLKATTDAHAQVGAKVVRQYKAIPAQLVSLPSGMSLQNAARIYSDNPAIDYVEPNYVVHALRVPNDTRYGELWGMQRIHAEGVWDLSIGDPGVVVAVIDTGINYDHEDIAANMWVNPNPDPALNDIHGARWTGGSGSVTSGDPKDDHNHGTHCAGTIGGVGDNAKGVAGVNWRVRLAAMKFLTSTGSGSLADAVSAIEYCVQRADQIKVLSNSWGGGGYSQSLYNIIEAAMNAGQLFVAAAGNDGSNTDGEPAYPAGYDIPNVISVAAIDSTGEIASFSNYGETSVDLGAPGVAILSSVALGSPQNANYEEFQGTSMACPHVAGAAALLWSIAPSASWQQIKNALLEGVQANSALVGKTVTGGDLDLMGSIAKIGGSIRFDQKSYRSSATARVTVSDFGVPVGSGSVPVELVMSNTVAQTPRWSTMLDLSRIPDSATFTNAVTLQSQPNATPYSAVNGDVLNGFFTDSFSRVVSASALIDDTPPVLSDLWVGEATESGFTVVWRSDEPANSWVRLGTTIPLSAASQVGSLAFVEELTVRGGVTGYWHSVPVSGLAEESRYYVAVLSGDYAGNTSSIPGNLASVNPADYAQMITRQRRVLWTENWEYGTQGWTVSNVQGQSCWEWGRPSYGPLSANSGEFCWGTVLDGNYPPLANASLTSLPFFVGEQPRLSFQHWMSVEGGADYCYVEANRGAGWELLATFTGSSAGWTNVNLDLPQSFNNQTVSFRFRLVSDYLGELAGWYLDDVVVSTISPVGVYVSAYDVLDNAPGGDGDGVIERGESFVLDLSVFNNQMVTASNVVAEVETPSPGVSIAGGPVKAVSYGHLTSGQHADSGSQLTVMVSNSVAVGSHLTLVVTLKADGLSERTEQINLIVEDRASVVGLVRDSISGLPVSGASVRGASVGYPVVTTLTEADGSYRLNGLFTNVPYQVSAALPGTYSRSPLVSLTSLGLTLTNDIRLGKAYAGPNPASLTFALDQGISGLVTVTLHNANAPYSNGYAFVATIVYDSAAQNWLSLDTVSGVVASNGTLALKVTAQAGMLNPSLTHLARIILTGNDISDLPVEIPVQLTVNAAPILDFAGWRVSGGASQDDDPFVEPGETADLQLDLSNGGSAAGLFVVGSMAYTGTNPAVQVAWAETTWPVFTWDGLITPSDTGPTLIVGAGVPEGEVLPLVLSVTDLFSRAWAFTFAITVDVRRTVSGVITECSDGTTPVPNAEVRVFEDGVTLAGVAHTDGAGSYRVDGLESLDCLVRVVPPVPFAAPAAKSVIFLPGDSAAIRDFCVAEWSISASPTSIVVNVAEGSLTNVALTLSNTGLTDGSVEFDIQLVSGMVEPAALAPMVYPPVPWDTLKPDEYAPDQLLVRFDDQSDVTAMSSILSQYDLQSVRTFHFVPAVLVKTSGKLPLREVAAALAAEPGVRYVEPNYHLHPYGVPDDTLFDFQWALRNTRQFDGTLGADINVVPAWDQVTGSSTVQVAIVDSGTDYTHPDLSGNYTPASGYDYGENDPDPITDYTAANFSTLMHGTHVAGIVGAEGNNAEGIAGVSWDVSLLPLKISYVEEIMTPLGPIRWMFLSLDAAVAAVEHCISNNVPISNHSYGGAYFSGLLYEAFRASYSNGHLAVAAAGNDFRNNNDQYFRYPVGYDLPNVIGVAASTPGGELADFSNYGANTVEIIAPGVDILSTVMDEAGLVPGYDAWSGTSMAAPKVAGAAALLKAASPSATWDMLKRALLDGARRDDNLQGMVTSGHMDVDAALHLLGVPWLTVAPRVLNVPAASSAQATVTFNGQRNLLAGTYKATILVRQGLNHLGVPVTLNVTPAPAPKWEATHVLDGSPGGDQDGFAEPGETVDLQVDLRNAGSALLLGASGTISTATSGVIIQTPTAKWPGMASEELAASLNNFRVAFGGAVTGSVPFTLVVKDSANRQTTLSFAVMVASARSITGVIRDATSLAGLSGVAVEYWGDAVGVVTSSAGGGYAIHGLSNGAYRLRALPTDRSVSAPTSVLLAGANGLANFSLAATAPTFGTNLNWTVLLGRESVTNWVLTNAGPAAFTFRITEMPQRKVALISDGTQLNSVAPLLRKLGFDVTVYSNNYYYFVDPDAGYGEARGLYSGDPALLAGYQLVIADLSGPLSGGRLLSDGENTAAADFLSRDRTLLLTGPNPITRPDDATVQALVGSDSLDRGTNAGPLSVSNSLAQIQDYLPFVAGETIQRSGAALDRATPVAGADREMLLGGGEDPKAYRYFPTTGGQVIYWGGNRNGSDWRQPGTLQDYFRTLLTHDYVQDVSWLTVSPTSGTVNAASNLNLSLTVNPVGLEAGAYRGNLVVLGNYPGEPVRAISITITAQMPSLRVKASVGVHDWLARALPGNGGPTSAIFQVLDAGPDGAINPPTPQGEPTGDDRVISLLPTDETLGRMGVGYESTPDVGRFSQLVRTTNAHIYVRAWDRSSFASSVAFGNSPMYVLTNVPGETADLLGWTVDQAPGYPGSTAKDTNGDGIPDGWDIKFGYDPRLTVGPLTPTSTLVSVVGSAGSAARQFNHPAKAFVAGELLFVLDTANHRVSVWNRTTGTNLLTYGSSGTAVGQFNQPAGLGRHPTANRFAVADTANHRVQIFDFNPVSGAISFVQSFGANGTTNGQFQSPEGVTIDPLGRIIVADTQNHRIQIFKTNGVYQGKFGSLGTASGQVDDPSDVASDAAGLLYVADRDNHRIQIFNGSGIYLWSIGGVAGASPGQFQNPRGVTVDNLGRIFVADTINNRIQLFSPQRNHLLSVGIFGSEPGQLSKPYGIAPIPSSGSFYAVDTWNNRLQLFSAVLDSDSDGLDDSWEYTYFSNLDEIALADPDGDGISNIGEFRIGSDPMRADSDGDGWSDEWEVDQGHDPGSPASPGIEVLHVGGSSAMALSWSALSGQVFKIQVTTSLFSGAWLDVPNSLFTNWSDGTASFTNLPSEAGSQRYFRPIFIP